MDELLYTLAAPGIPRAEMLDGREHLVVPVIALMEGVIHAVNAEVPEYVPASTLSANPSSWDGMPLMIGHPTQNGVQVSAKALGEMAKRGFGQIKAARFKDGKLGVEAWADVRRLEELGHQQMLADMRAGKPIEVSVGAHVKTLAEVGVFGDKPYKASWKEITPDHLAFLPGGRGACSLAMGCGAGRMAEASIRACEAADFRALWPDSSGNDDHGREHEVGTRVTVANTHWNKTLHGKTGTVYSTTTDAEGQTSHYVKGLYSKGGGEFVRASDLVPAVVRFPGKDEKYVAPRRLEDFRTLWPKADGTDDHGRGNDVVSPDIGGSPAEFAKWGATAEGFDPAKAYIELYRRHPKLIDERPSPRQAQKLHEALSAIRVAMQDPEIGMHMQTALGGASLEHIRHEIANLEAGGHITGGLGKKADMPHVFDTVYGRAAMDGAGKAALGKLIELLDDPEVGKLVALLLHDMAEDGVLMPATPKSLSERVAAALEPIFRSLWPKSDGGDDHGRSDDGKGRFSLHDSQGNKVSSHPTRKAAREAKDVHEKSKNQAVHIVDNGKHDAGKEVVNGLVDKLYENNEIDVEEYNNILDGNHPKQGVLDYIDGALENGDMSDKDYGRAIAAVEAGAFKTGGKSKAKYMSAAAKSRDCTMCDGMGQVDGKDCPACDGEGKIKAAEAANEESESELRAACSCREGADMKTKAERIKALMADEYNPLKDVKSLEAMPDDGIKALEDYAAAQAKTAGEVKAASEKAAADLKAANEKVTALEANAAKPLTEEQFMAAAPADVKTLIEGNRAAAATRKEELVGKLKTAQDAYDETALKALSLAELEKLAKVAKVDVPAPAANVYTFPSAHRSAESKDALALAAPPNPYEAGIKAAQAKF